MTARLSPAASSAALRTSTTSAVPSGAGEPISSTPGLEELAGLPPLRADGAVGAGVVEEAERRLGRGVAVGDDAGDRQRRVRAHREHAALGVEEAVGGRDAGRLAAGQDVVELDRRGRNLAVAEALEDLGQLCLEGAQLAHLVGQDVPAARRDRMRHRGGPAATRAHDRPRRARCARRGRAGARRSLRIRGRSARCCRSPSAPPPRAPR